MSAKAAVRTPPVRVVRKLGLEPWRREEGRIGLISAHEKTARDAHNQAIWAAIEAQRQLKRNDAAHAYDLERSGATIQDLRSQVTATRQRETAASSALSRAEDAKDLMAARMEEVAVVIDCCSAASTHHRIDLVTVEHYHSLSVMYRYGQVTVTHVISDLSRVSLTLGESELAEFYLPNGQLIDLISAMIRAFFEAVEAVEVTAPTVIANSKGTVAAVISLAYLEELSRHRCEAPERCAFHMTGGLFDRILRAAPSS